MGVPGLFRWLSEKYTKAVRSLSELQEDESLEIDNLYLDMNGLIHPCTREPASEDEYIARVCECVTSLLEILQPTSVLFLAIDGVAPRAKMNQQRSRRFRSARDKSVQREKAEELRTQWREMGLEVSPDCVQLWDSNAITPGTPFMAHLAQRLTQYVVQMVASHPRWKHLQVLVSDNSVPGEGEHKLIEFVRVIRKQPTYSPATRHAIFGLDADLMLLALGTHELNFYVLRGQPQPLRSERNMVQRVGEASPTELPGEADQEEEQQRRAQVALPLDMDVVSIPMLREYLRHELYVGPVDQVPEFHEFRVLTEEDVADEASDEDGDEVDVDLDDSIREALGTQGTGESSATPSPNPSSPPVPVSLPAPAVSVPFEWDFERVLDDFILLCTFVGNDFLPHLPSLEIREGALDALITLYKSKLPVLGGYLTCGSQVHLERVRALLATVGEWEQAVFQRRLHLVKKFRNWGRRDGSKHVRTKLVWQKLLRMDGFQSLEDGSVHRLEATDEELREMDSLQAQIVRQVEFYLSDRNLPTDFFLLDHVMNNGGWAQVAVLGSFNRLRSLSPDVEFVATALLLSPRLLQVEKHDDEWRVRRRVPLRCPLGQDDLVLTERDFHDQLKAMVQKEQDSNGNGRNNRVQATRRLTGKAYKSDYYQEKFNVDVENQPESLHKMYSHFLEGICWVHSYYMSGCPSWHWFFPYHYAPFASDLAAFTPGADVPAYTQGRPFQPLTQLLSVLPPASSHCLPDPYATLMTNDDSPLKSFYPLEFDTDRNGKMNEWEAITLLPFIDAVEMLYVIKKGKLEEQLSEDESQRNAPGNTRLIRSAASQPTHALLQPFVQPLSSNDEGVDTFCVTMPEREARVLPNRPLPDAMHPQQYLDRTSYSSVLYKGRFGCFKPQQFRGRPKQKLTPSPQEQAEEPDQPQQQQGEKQQPAQDKTEEQQEQKTEQE